MPRTSKVLPYLTRAESELMQLLWETPGTVSELLPRLGRDVVYTTVLNTLRTLEQKGYVRHQPAPADKRAFLYEPAVPQAEVKKRHLGDLISRFFGGKADGLVAGLIDDEPLSTAELQTLRKKIDERLKSKGRKS